MKELDLKEYIGIPFESCGKGHSGINCWELLRLIYREKRGILLTSYADEYIDAYSYTKISKAVGTHVSEWILIKKATEQPFDVILFNLRGLPIHLGMVVKLGQMIHVLPKVNTCLERYNTTLWNKRIRGFYRYAK